MSVDIAVLGLEVRSDGVVVASDRLKQLTAEGGKAEQATGKLSSSFSNLEKYVQAAQAAFAAAGIGMFVKASIDAALQIERMTKLFNAATGSANLAAREQEYVRGVTNKLGLDLVSTTESYGKFMAAIKGSTLEGERGRKVFESVSGATTALGLRADETAGLFKALEQMMSKGKVQAEELRGQLAERLPGAFKMAADAMGISTAQLDKNLALGKVMAEDLLPALAVQLEKTYGKAALEGANSAQAAINRMNNAMLESKATVGSSLMPVFTSLVENVFTPMVKLIGDIVRGLQSMAAAAALVVNQFMGGMGDIFSGRIFTKDGYKQSMADALENEKIYKEQMDKIWNGPSSTDYTAAERLRQSGNKPVAALADGKGAKEADRYRQAVMELRKDIDLLSTSMSDHDKSLFSASVEYDKLILKYPQHRAELEGLRSEKIKAIQTEQDLKNAIADTTKGLAELQAQTEAMTAAERAYWQEIANTVKQVESLQPGAAVAAIDKQISDIYLMAEKLPDMAGKAQIAIDALLKFRETEQEIQDINNGLIDDPYQRQLAQIETFYQRKFDLIDQERNALMGLQDANKSNFDQYLKYQKKIEQLDDKEAALKREKTKELTETHADAMRSQLSMAGFYTSVAGGMFSALAETQDQSSRKGFETAKAFNIAATVMNTASAIMNAMATVPWPASVAAAALAATTGAVQIANIASTSFGGGATAPSVPSGSFGAGSSGGGSSLGNITAPIASIGDSQTTESLLNLTESTDNVALAIGRLSKSMDDLTAIFEQGGAGYTLATNAPGRFGMTTANDMPGVVSILKSLDPMHNLIFGKNPIEFFKGVASAVGSALFGGSWYTKSAGIALSVDAGQISADDYLYRKKSGGLFGSSKSKYVYDENVEATAYMQGLMAPFISDMERMALTLGTTIDTSKYSSEITRIKTSGRKEEDIAKDLEDWTLKTLQGMALTVDGLRDFVGAYDDAYAKLKEFNDALVSTNDAFELIGKTALQGSLATGEFLTAVQRDLFGGMEGFNEAIDTYFGSLFTDAEQEAALAAQAQRDLDRAFAEMGQTIPATRQEFRDLVNSLDITTVSGAQLFAGLMDVSESFGLVMTAAEEAADKLKEIQSAMQDLDVRYLVATGQDAAADAMSRQLSAQREIEQAITDNMGEAYIARLREVLTLEEQAATHDQAKSNLEAAFSAEKARLTEAYNAELATLNEQLQAANGVVSTLTGYVNKLVSARQRMQLQDAAYQRDQYAAAQAMLAATLVAARGGDLSSLANMDESLQILTSQGADAYANSTDYQRDFWQTKNGILELEQLAGNQLTDAEKSVELARQQIDVLKSNHDAQLSALDALLNALIGINTSVLSLQAAIAAFGSALNAVADYQQPSSVLSTVDDYQPPSSVLSRFTDEQIQHSVAFVQQVAAAGNITGIAERAIELGVTSQELAAISQLAGYTDVKTSDWLKFAEANGLPAFATGGITSGISIAGEAGPEAVVPLPDGRRIPVQMSGSADNADVVEAINALRAEVVQLKSANAQMSKALQKQLQYTEDWDANGLPEVRTA